MRSRQFGQFAANVGTLHDADNGKAEEFMKRKEDLRSELDPALILENQLGLARAEYAARNVKSHAMYEKACRWMPGGNTRTGLHYEPFPLTFLRGEGANLWDADGHSYLDFLGDFTNGIYGHNNAVIRQAVSQALDNGTSFGGVSIYEAKLAALICERFSSIETVRFCNSGTEANLLALSLARLATGRKKILAFREAYHGSVLTFSEAGARIQAPFDVILADYNDIDGTIVLIDQHRDDLAAVIVEPMMGAAGCIPGDQKFMDALRVSTERYNIVLLFDEVLTSRLSPGGAQQIFKITPDLTSLGKYIGGGFTFGAFGGRKDLMERFDPRAPDHIVHSGTFNNNIATLAAGTAGFGKVYTPDVNTKLNKSGDSLRLRINNLADTQGQRLMATGLGSVMHLHFSDRPIRSPRDIPHNDEKLTQLLHIKLIEAGYIIASRGLVALSLPLTANDHTGFLKAIESFVDKYSGLYKR